MDDAVALAPALYDGHRQRLAANIVQLELLDHFIVSSDRVFTSRKEGLM